MQEDAPLRKGSRMTKGIAAVASAAVVLAICAAGALAALGSLTFVESETDGTNGVVMAGPNDVAVSPNGANVYATAQGSDGVAVFTRNPGTGEMVWVETEIAFPGGINKLDSPNDVAVAPNGLYVYATSGVSNTVVVFDRDPGTGALTYNSHKEDMPGSNLLAGADGVAVSPNSATVYVVGSTDNSVTAFLINPGGGLGFQDSETDGDPGGVDGLNDANDVIVAPDGENVYTTASGADNAVTTFNRSAGGNLTFVATDKDTPATLFENPIGLDASEDNENVYVAGNTENSITTFTRAANGTLTLLEADQDGMLGNNGLAGAFAVDVAPEGASVYVAANGENTVGTFSRDQGNGGLTFVEVDATGGLPRGVAVSADSKHVYAGASLSNDLSVWSRELLAPFNTADPTIGEGPTAEVDSTLTCDTGTWGGVPTPVLTIQWLRNGADIPGATMADYLTVDADRGNVISCRVTATSSAGTASETNPPEHDKTIVKRPENTATPVVTGSAVVGSTLSCSDGTWDATPAPPVFTREWLRNGLPIAGRNRNHLHDRPARHRHRDLVPGGGHELRGRRRGDQQRDSGRRRSASGPAASGSQAELQRRAGQRPADLHLPGPAHQAPDGGREPAAWLQHQRDVGRVKLTSAKADGTPQSADFYEGQFKVTQETGKLAGTKATGLLTTLTLTGPPACPKPKAKKKTNNRSVAHASGGGRRLWGSGGGSYRTRGGRSAATVRGTTWLTQDSCKGTLTKVTEGSVEVDDFGKKKNVTVTAPRSYLAKPKASKKG